MKLVKILEAVDQQINESMMRIEIDTSPFPVMVAVNPGTREALATLEKAAKGELRGLVDLDKDKLYMWDSYKATHMDIAEALGLYSYNEVVMTKVLPNNKLRSISMDHSATNAFIGPDYILFTRDIPKVRMFMCVERLFSDGQVKKVDLD